MKNKRITASVLSFERKLSNSDALMYSGKWDQRDVSQGWNPISINRKAVRGTISHRLKASIASDPAKLNAEIQKPNLQTIEVAALPFETDTLMVKFTIRFLGCLDQPAACNDEGYQKALVKMIQTYTEEVGFENLATRYAFNIVNGRFLWRNRVGAEAIEVRVKHENKEWVFNAMEYGLQNFTPIKPELKELINIISEGFKKKKCFPLLEVRAFVKLGSGQEVYPSQELQLEKGQSGKGDISKLLYQLEKQGGIAALHSQKVGNALRTIDTWHPYTDEVGPIAVEPYGSVTSRGEAYRNPKEKMDFYTLLDKWINGEKPSLDQQHFVIAMLIRGGVFGEKESKEDKKDETEE